MTARVVATQERTFAHRFSYVAAVFPLATLSPSVGCNTLSGVNDLDFGGQPDASVADGSLHDALVCDGGSDTIGVIGEPCCSPNALACAGHAQKLVIFCDPKTQTWAALQSCDGNTLCDTAPGPNQGSCQEPVALCIGHRPGDFVCEGNTQVECGPDLLTRVDTECPSACRDGACAGSCKPGAKQCDGLVPQSCAPNGEWANGLPCSYVCIDASCTGQCIPGSKQCNGNASQSCDASGRWEVEAECPVVCTGGKCVDSCLPGAVQCSGNTAQICNGSGAWDDGAACPYLCSAGVCEGDCVPDDRRCEGETPQACDLRGLWQSGSPCPFVCANGECVGECEFEDAQCVGLTPQTCDSAGQWTTQAECTYVCSAGACTGVCAPGSKQCDVQIPQECDATGQWLNGAPCAAVCTAGTCAGSCAPGSKQCNGQVPQTCVGTGTWESGAPCEFVCISGDCAGVCVPGTKDCNGLVPRTCSSTGQWNSGSPCPFLCAAGACTGECLPGATRCSGNLVQTCQPNAMWNSGTACGGATPNCDSGVCVASFGPGCDGLAPTCGPDGTRSCCASATVTGGTFFRSYDAVKFTNKGYPATVSEFKLDIYEITVGRFRKFVAEYPGNKPVGGAGKNPNNPTDPGWAVAWNSILPPTKLELTTGVKCSATDQTWTDSPGGNESHPINCVTWYEAFAFCIWDGGRLPTEAEWNYAAAGGGGADGQRVYAWSVPSKSSAIDDTFAVYCASTCAARNVGSLSPRGDGKWGHADLIGNEAEWVLDFRSASYPNPCVDCANTTSGSARMVRGGGFTLKWEDDLYVSVRDYYSPTLRDFKRGARCARAQ